MSSIESTAGVAAVAADAPHPRVQAVKRGILLAYSGPALGLYAIGLPVAVYLPPFYADDLGLGLTLVGQIFMLCRFFDLAADLTLGTISDRVRSSFGRRRPMMALAVPLMCLGAYHMFMPSPGVGVLYVVGWMLVMYAGYALGVISHMSWGAELSPDYHQRSRVQGWREMAGSIGMVAVLALPAVLEQFGDGSKADRIAAMGWFVIAIFPVGVLIAVLRVPDPARAHENVAHLSIRQAMGTLAKNRLVQRVLVADLFAGIAPAVASALYIFLVEAVVREPGITASLLLGYFISGILGVPLWLSISYRLGKHWAFAIGAVWNCVIGACFLFVGQGDVALLTALTLLFGLGYSSGTFLLRAVMADVADVDELRTGRNRTGLFYGLLTMTNKIGYALAVGVTYPILAAFGFSPQAAAAAVKTGAEIPGANALLAMYVFVPMAMNLAGAFVMSRFPLDAKALAEVHRQLALQRDNA
ncbi:MFS transporter [Zavarzinia sp.]|uniref:MFS transporter n=1 Tax=Zavarzinia sp. TaxID=2027920 RepID=UPI00356ADB91